MTDLNATAAAIIDIRDTARELLKPCGFGCDCTRAGHVDKLHASAPSDLSVEALAEQLLRTVGEANAELSHYGAIPGFAEVIAHSWQTLKTLNLFVEHQLVQQWAIGDLPEFADRQGSPRQTGRYEGNAGTFVYVAYDLHGKVIYVGVTDDLFGRMAGHRSSKRWWPHMERLEWEEWPSREPALRKESTLIRRYRPKYNIVGNPDAKRPR